MTVIESLADALDVADSVAVRLGHRSTGPNARALQAAAAALAADPALGSELRISPVVRLLDGPLFRIDDLPDEDASRDRIRSVIATAVRDAGGAVDDLHAAPLDGLAALDRCTNAVVLRLFPSPRGAEGVLPANWISLAADWVFGDLAPDAIILMRVLGVELRVSRRDATETLEACAAARTWCDVVSGDLASRVRTASLSFGIAPHVAIAAGGPRCDSRGLLARFDLLEEVSHDHATGAYACIDFEKTFEFLGLGFANSAWAAAGGAPPNRLAGSLGDRYVPDAFPVQILGPAHADALGELHDLAPLGNGRSALAIGEPEGWMTGTPTRELLQQQGWSVLAPLLLRPDGLDHALASRQGGAFTPIEVETSEPLLDSIVLDDHAHLRRGARLSVLELAAWHAGEPHSDAPTTVSPVLRSYVREVAAGLDDDLRQELIPLAATLVGTGPASADAEEARCWIVADALLRVHTPAWLEHASLKESATRLRSLRPGAADTQVVRGVDLIGRSISTAGRRLDAGLDLAGRRRDEIDTITWEVWESVSQRTGWAAAADTVTMGVPGELTFTTDQRAMECSRDPEQRAAMEKRRQGLGDEIWSTALSQAARMAWDSAWGRAERILETESRFSFKGTLRRTLMTELDDPRGVTVDMVLDDVDAAARDKIARLILVGDDESDYWDKGIGAARSVDGGNFWRKALEETRTLLGATLFDEATRAARDDLAGWARRAPRLVSRAVVASVTREACSIAGRAAIARTASEVARRGGSAGEVRTAVDEFVDPLVPPLARAAVALLSEMVAVSE